MRPARLIHRLLMRCRRGTAAVEAAFIMPVLILALLGMVELSAFLEANRKAMSAAQTVADLVSQEKRLGTSDMADIRAAADVIMNPLSPTGAEGSLLIASVGFRESDGAPRLLWLDDGGSGISVDPTLADDLGVGGESIILVQLNYNYSSPFGFMFQSETLLERSFVRPRLSRLIEYNGVTGADKL